MFGFRGFPHFRAKRKCYGAAEVVYLPGNFITELHKLRFTSAICNASDVLSRECLGEFFSCEAQLGKVKVFLKRNLKI